MKKSLLFPLLGLSMTSLAPLSFVVSCGNRYHYGLDNGDKKQLPPIEVKTEVLGKMFAARKDPDLYEKLKNNPFVITNSDNNYVLVKNDYVKFRFTKEFVDTIVMPQKYTIEEYSKIIFKQLNLSPSIEFMHHDYQFDFLTYDGPRLGSPGGLTDNRTDSAIEIKAPLYSKTVPSLLGTVCNEEYFQVEQTAIYSKPWPTWNEKDERSSTISFSRLVFNEISKELNDKDIKVKKYDELFPNTSNLLPSYQDELNTDYSFLERWNSDEDLKEIANKLTNLLNKKQSIAEVQYESSAFMSQQDAMFEMLKRLGDVYCLRFNDLKNNLVSDTSNLPIDATLEGSMFHEICQIFNFNLFDNDKPRESFDIMSTLFNNVMSLGAIDNSCIYLTQDNNNKFKVDKINYKSFGNEFTENVDKLQVFDNKTNQVLHEYRIDHKDYPLGFNRNPFTDYEYKYVAPGAYLVDNNVSWDIGNHNLEDIRLNVILKNGQKILQNKIFVNAKISLKNLESSNEYAHCKYLNESLEWKDTAEFYS